METYFRSTDDTHGGHICEEEVGMHDAVDAFNEIYRKSFQELGGEYIRRDENEKTCAIRMPPIKFFEVLLAVRVRTSAEK